jgi:hypothetical protein
MIDFRYHLVSLVSVFLALAVGIVLGAGPLKDSIGSTLTAQVRALRQEKDTLRGDLDTANSSVDHRNTFITDVEPTLIAGQLTDRSVVMVILPGVNSDVVQPLVDAITVAGGTVTGRVSISGSWADPTKENQRSQVLTDLGSKLPVGTLPLTGTVDGKLTELLADSLVTTGGGGIGHASTASSTVLSSMRSGNLITIKGDLAGLAGAALVLAPDNPAAEGKAEPTSAATTMQSYANLASTLDGVGGGAVVSGPLSAATSGGLLSVIRKNDAAKSRVSTVDTGQTSMGVVTAVLALREQLAGGSGAYGFGNGVSKPLPTLTTITTTTPSATPSTSASKR